MVDTLHVVRLGPPNVHLEEGLIYDKAQAAEMSLGYTYINVADEAQTIQAVRDADVVICPGKRMTRQAIQAMRPGRLIIATGIGYDYVDTQAATDNGIVVANMPFFCFDEVADHAMSLLLTCVRKIVRLDRAMRAGRWPRDILVPIPGLRGKWLGIIGAGNTGQAMAHRAQAFGMAVMAYNSHVRPGVAEANNLELVSLDELLARADFISLHVPLNAGTRHLITERELRLMKPTAFLVNTSRGAVIDEQALIRALSEGWIAGAGLDVFEREPLPANSPLRAMENVVLTPHSGGYSEASIAKEFEGAWDHVRTYVKGEWPATVVNPQVLKQIGPPDHVVVNPLPVGSDEG